MFRSVVIDEWEWLMHGGGTGGSNFSMQVVERRLRNGRKGNRVPETDARPGPIDRTYRPIDRTVFNSDGIGGVPELRGDASVPGPGTGCPCRQRSAPDASGGSRSGSARRTVRVEPAGYHLIGVLQISGERSREQEEKNDKWHRVERSSGKFLRRFRLPENAKVDEVKAAMENGVLTVTVPKEQVKKPDVKAIDISA
ncbi:class I heat shock protein [Cinnamomum micranthum f. kanehirae]|uniref:Class I heat shock protein n=1 Tax=Cinnamomum micranthum f. kanehirae TaxID=337451 RepID=A0A443Q2R7_9MAGN|nr:class I heat shock protein [Cinnamomum micranthum f. kanehirae]